MMKKFYITGFFLLLFSQSSFAQLTVTGLVINCSCFQFNDGAIYTTVTGGSGSYTYDWGLGVYSPNRFNLAAGTYSVTVTDTYTLNTAFGTWVVSQPGQILIDATTVPVSCSGNDGCIYINYVMGGTPPYYYLWNNGATTMNLCGLACGIYTVTVVDSHNCDGTGSWEVTTNMTLTAAIVKNCDPLQTKINLTVHDGCGPFTYQWGLTGSTWAAYSQNISNLTCGTYCVTVTDIMGCHKSSCWVYEDLFLNEQVCVAGGGNSGSITLNVTCGTPGYTYQWSYIQNPALIIPPDPAIFNLYAGWYCVTVTDSKTPTPLSKICCFEVGAKKSTCQVSYIQDITVPSGGVVCYDALSTMYVAGNSTTFIVETAGNATMIAGEKIKYLPGTRVYNGGLMHGYITTDGQFCQNKNSTGDANAGGIGPDSIPQPFNPENQVFKVYPNPTTGTFILELNGEITGNQVMVEVYGNWGKKVLMQALHVERRHEFSLTGMPVGMYFIHVVSGDKSETVKLIKQ